jgi:hypothetical protein
MRKPVGGVARPQQSKSPAQGPVLITKKYPSASKLKL